MSTEVNIGRAIKLLRVSGGLKQLELAERVKVSPNHLSLVEAGRKEPSLSLLRRISAALDVPLAFLVWESTDQDKNLPAEERHVTLKLKEALLDFERLRVARIRPRKFR
jgi:transcriptional regulator with XRE-family HTH domain